MDFSYLQPRPSTSSSYFPPHRTQLHPRMHPPPQNPTKSQSQHKFLLFFASLFTIPFLFYLFFTARKIHLSSQFAPTPKTHSFGVVISSSAATTATSVRVYNLLGESGTLMPLVVGSKKVRRGIGVDPGGVVEGLVGFAKEWVPKKEWGGTKVQLLLVGGKGEGEVEVEKGVLEMCRKVLRVSGFAFRDEWARVIREEEKGVYAWVAVNYALGSLGSDAQKTTGIVQLGATSLQVTVASREVSQAQSSRLIKLAGVTYNLQTQSLQKFGQDAAWKLLHESYNSKELMTLSRSRDEYVRNPCIPNGYELESNASHAELLSHPAGNFTACRREALELLKSIKEKCLHPPCQIVSSFFLELRGKPVSQENLFYASELFGLFPSASLSELEAAGQHYCEDDWDKLKDQHSGIDVLDLLRYCFSSAYTVALLHDGLGIAMNDKRIGFADQSGSFPTDWTLGVFVLQSMLQPLELETDNLDQIVGYESVTYFSLFAFLLIVMLAAFFVLQWRKPQLKTIYDLEKGRYIVTRVPR